MRRLFDLGISLTVLILTLPVLLPVMFLIYWKDKHSPFYVAPRMGKGEVPFKMIKLRSMVIGADKSGVDSTSSKDPRITAVGHFVRRYKLDELPQLINVIKGEMSLVGPRPNVKRETDLYTPVEKRLLMVRPGVTDLASVVFSDENDILKDSSDPDIDYNQRIRPWKSRLALIFVERSSVELYFRILYVTAIALVSRRAALERINQVLLTLGTDDKLATVARREVPLFAYPPPGASEIVTSRS